MTVASFAKRAVFVCLLVFTLSGGSPTAAAETTYSVEDIGTLVGTGDGQFDALVNTLPGAINNHGDVVANAYPTDGPSWLVAFTYFDGKVRRLGRERDYSNAFDINDKGEVAGYIMPRDAGNFSQTQAVVWRERDAIALPPLGEGSSQALAINQAGDVVGSSVAMPGGTHATLWSGEETVDLGTLGGANSYSFDVNNGQVVVGYSFVDGDERSYPFQWQAGEMAELPVPDDLQGAAIAINDDGVVVGIAIEQGPDFVYYYAIRWVDGEAEMLDTLVDGGRGYGADINSSGQIVGWSTFSPEGAVDSVAVLWEGDEIIDLNERVDDAVGYTLLNAISINESGQILASGKDDAGIQHSLLLTPSGGAQTKQNVALLSPQWRSARTESWRPNQVRSVSIRQIVIPMNARLRTPFSPNRQRSQGQYGAE